MKIHNLYKNLSIAKKINIIFGLFLFFAILAFYSMYKSQVNKILNDTNVYMMESLDDLTHFMEILSSITAREGFTQEDYDYLKPFFEEKTYYETRYPFLVTRSGDFLIHPWKEGTNEVSTGNHQRRLSYGEGSGLFRYYFSLDGKPKWQYVNYVRPYDAYVTATFYEYEFYSEMRKVRIMFFGFLVIGLLLMLFLRRFIQTTVGAIKQGVNFAEKTAIGDLDQTMIVKHNDEMGLLAKALNDLQTGLKQSATFARKIGEGQLDEDYKILGENDQLGKALISMRNSLKQAKEEELLRKEEDKKRNWATQGQAEFVDVLRKNNDNIEKLSLEIIRKTVKYLNINQGGLFLLNNETDKPFLELTACYAYDRQKYIQKSFSPGEGLVGSCFLEKKTTYITALPKDYISITSGLGDENPSALLIVPLMLNEDVLGVLELASFNPFEEHQINFLEKLGESIASVVSGVRTNMQTAYLLEQSQQQAEEMRAQEEEMRQNMEELQATQEEMERKEKEMQQQSSTIKNLFILLETDPEGNIINVNQNFEEVSGFALNELTGKNTRMLFGVKNQDNDNRYIKFSQSILGKEPIEAIINRTTKSGADFKVKAIVYPVFDFEGKLVKYVEMSLQVDDSSLSS